MYDSDLADIEEIGWDRFIYGAWEAIFLGYRSFGGIRSIGRRWSDLLQAGLGCPEEIADTLVRDQVIAREDRDLMAIKDPERLLAAMAEVLADIGAQLADLAAIAPAERERLLAAHQRLTEFLAENFEFPAEGF
ncbi:MAG TPA: hypothetical protein VMA72_10900 [Streptosporangiaceae bacterium]|nr:hypothetical protein [Streptosporangiaceae bacterium]